MASGNTGSVSLSGLWTQIESYFSDSGASSLKTDALHSGLTPDQAIIELVVSCLELVDRTGIFSKNEEIDDYSTSSLKFLKLRYYLAKAHSNISDISLRYSHLRQAKASYEEFIRHSIKCRLINSRDIGYDEDGDEDIDENPDKKRMKKIELFKQNREAQKRIMVLTKTLSSATKKDDDDNDDHEDEIREREILILQCLIRDSVNELPMISQEMQLLRHREDLADSGTPLMPSLPPTDGPGLSITKINKIGDQLITTREQIKADVFKPRMEAPSISLEEYGDMVKAEAEARAKTEAANKTNNPGVRRFKQLQEDGEEDNPELADQATLAEREWDDFKEANPRGWGNKANKRY